MKLYPEIDVDLNWQNWGSRWLIILRGSEENILTVFNSLWNWKATSGELNFTDHTRTVAVFWSAEEKMRNYFFNKYDFHHGLPDKAAAYAEDQIQAMFTEQESFMERQKVCLPDEHNVGKIRAERPDSDFKDKVLTYSLADKS